MKAIFIIGQTASGKSQFAIDVAKKINGIIINCDSIQFYEPLKIGSAAPTTDDFATVQHYLYSYVKPPTEMTAGQFLRDFYELINSDDFMIKNKSRTLIIVGGTGFYIQALEKGMYNIPPVSENLKKEIEHEILEFGNQKAYKELIEFDPDSKIHVNDSYRLGRALEIKRSFNLKISEIQKHLELDTKFKLPFDYLKIGVEIEKENLIKNIQTRTRYMLNNGIIDETQNLINLGFQDWAPLGSVGYYEVKEFLNGRIDQSDLESRICTSTLQLTKKQKTWFKRDTKTMWLNPEISSDQKSILEKIEKLIK